MSSIKRCKFQIILLIDKLISPVESVRTTSNKNGGVTIHSDTPVFFLGEQQTNLSQNVGHLGRCPQEGIVTSRS